MVGLQIGAKPDAGFEDPIGMLIDCHRRVESFLHVLCLVAERGRGKCLTEEEAAAVNAALNYFRSGGKRHTADEEESLFPRLRGISDGSALEELDRPGPARSQRWERICLHLSYRRSISKRISADVGWQYPQRVSSIYLS